MNELKIKQLDAHVEEYRVIWAEINMRLESEERLMEYTILIIAAAVPVLATLFQDAQTRQAAFLILLFLPLVFLIITLRFIGQDDFINILGGYVFDELRPKVNALLLDEECSLALKEGPVWNWEIYKHDRLFGTTTRKFLHAMYGSSRIVLTYLAGLTSLIVFLYLKAHMQIAWSPEERALVALNALGLLVLLPLEVARERHHPLARAFAMMHLRRVKSAASQLESCSRARSKDDKLNRDG